MKYYFYMEKAKGITTKIKYNVEDIDHNVYFKIETLEAGLIKNSQVQFTSMKTGRETVFEIGKQHITKRGGGFKEKLYNSAQNHFTINGENNWDLFLGIGYSYEAEIVKLKPVYTLFDKDRKVIAEIHSTGKDVFSDKPSGLFNKIAIPGYYQIEVNDEEYFDDIMLFCYMITYCSPFDTVDIDHNDF